MNSLLIEAAVGKTVENFVKRFHYAIFSPIFVATLTLKNTDLYFSGHENTLNSSIYYTGAYSIGFGYASGAGPSASLSGSSQGS